MTTVHHIALLMYLGFAASIAAFTPMNQAQVSSYKESQLKMGIFDDLKLIFSEEGKTNRAAFDEQQKIEQEAAQRQIMERRRNPEKMEEYENEVAKRRQNLNEESSLWEFQKDSTGSDPMVKWSELRAEGKIKVGDDIERDPTSSRLGSEGLQEIRTDDKLPYIEQGYVDEDADFFGNIKKIFGNKKE